MLLFKNQNYQRLCTLQAKFYSYFLIEKSFLKTLAGIKLLKILNSMNFVSELNRYMQYMYIVKVTDQPVGFF